MRTLTKVVLPGILLALVAAACTTSGEEQTTAQAEAATQLASSLSNLQATLADTSQELRALEARVDVIEAQSSGFRQAAGTHVLDRTTGVPEPPDGMVAIRLGFGYVPKALPGDGIVTFESSPEVDTVWAMESLAPGQELPVGPPLADRTLFLEPGASQTVTVTYLNPTSDDVAFLVTPHQDSPGTLNGLVWPTCLCFSFPYSAPANGSWYRVIKITASPDLPAGSKVDIVWTVLTDPSVFPEA
jgi:hypothetical protein